MPGVGGMAQPGKNRSDGLSGYRQNKSASKPRKKGSYSPVPKSKTKPRLKPQAGSVITRQPKFK